MDGSNDTRSLHVESDRDQTRIQTWTSHVRMPDFCRMFIVRSHLQEPWVAFFAVRHCIVEEGVVLLVRIDRLKTPESASSMESQAYRGKPPAAENKLVVQC